MTVLLTVTDGQDTGRDLRIDEPTNLVIGRDDPTSEANFRLTDPYLSRHHLMLEVRPPACLVRDLGSTNHTYLEQSGSWQRVEETTLTDGDRIKVGRSVLTMRLLAAGTVTVVDQVTTSTPLDLEAATSATDLGRAPDSTKPVPPDGSPPPRWEEPVLLCLRCGQALDQALLLRSRSLTSDDLVCDGCHAKEQQARARGKQSAATVSRCDRCHNDVSDTANSDGLAQELAGVARYFCERCANDRRRLPSRTVGAYRLLSELGRGGFGVVYLGWHTTSGRLVAVKQQLAKSGAMMQGARLRFLREQAIMHELVHPGIVRLYDVGSEDGFPYFVSEFVEGGHVGRYVDAAGQLLLNPMEVLQVIDLALDALAYVHARGFVHRDLKPENLLVTEVTLDRPANGPGQAGQHDDTPTRRPKICDLGLARNFAQHGGTLTRVGECAGTALYMPPEQITDFRGCGPATDVYAMGVVTFYLLSGQLPLDFPAPWQLAGGGVAGARLVARDPMLMALEDPRTSLARYRPDLPLTLIEAVDKATHRDLPQRHPSARAFGQALAKAAEDMPGA
jgi:eukaryotic-like serine/threonine-protein kinase